MKENPPEEKELENALHTFKNNKSSGTDKLKTEGLKYNSSKKLVNALMMLLTLIWTSISIPMVWLHALITYLHKKEALGIAKNYRGHSIGANMSRILAKIVINILKEAYETNIRDS